MPKMPKYQNGKHEVIILNRVFRLNDDEGKEYV